MDLTTVLFQKAACSAEVLKQVTSPGLYRGGDGKWNMVYQTDQGYQRRKPKAAVLVGLGAGLNHGNETHNV